MRVRTYTSHTFTDTCEPVHKCIFMSDQTHTPCILFPLPFTVKGGQKISHNNHTIVLYKEAGVALFNPDPRGTEKHKVHIQGESHSFSALSDKTNKYGQDRNPSQVRLNLLSHLYVIDLLAKAPQSNFKQAAKWYCNEVS